LKVPKTVKNIGVSIGAMVLIFLVAGIVYVFLTGRQEPAAPAKPAAKKTSTPDILKPAKPAANAPEGVALETIDSPVKAGENTSISVRTNAGSTCSIVVTYKGVVSHDSGLADHASDAYGFATWTWTVEPTVPPGTYPVKVTCSYHGRTGVAIDHLAVTAP
jgi:hypothetical protein